MKLAKKNIPIEENFQENQLASVPKLTVNLLIILELQRAENWVPCDQEIIWPASINSGSNPTRYRWKLILWWKYYGQYPVFAAINFEEWDVVFAVDLVARWVCQPTLDLQIIQIMHAFICVFERIYICIHV